jgi:hypothetical protein
MMRAARNAVPRAALLLSGALLGCEIHAPDSALLRTLSEDELHALCDDAADTLARAAYLTECSEGWTVSAIPPHEPFCRDLEVQDCEATAGDVRACARAVSEDPCAAAARATEACAPLHAGGCVPELTAAPLLSSCSPPSRVALAAFEGIYEVVRHTANETSCDLEGSSVLERDTQGFFVVVESEFAGAPIGLLGSCTDLEDCRATAQRLPLPPSDASASAPRELERSLECDEAAPSALLGGPFAASPSGDPLCEAFLTFTTATRAADGSLRLEDRTFDWRTTADPNGCAYIFGRRRPDGVPCTALEVYEARFSAAL